MKMFNKQRKYDIFFIITCLLMCTIIFRRFIFGDSLYIYSSMPQADTIASYFPYYKYLVQQITSGQFSFWSFEMGAGTSTLSVYSFLLDPFNLLYIIFGSDRIQNAIIYVSILKIILAGLFFYKYINKITKNNYVSFITGLLYAFSGYMIAWGQHYFFATFYVLVALVLFCIERWIADNKKWLLLSISISITAISNIYLLYMFSIYICAYLIIRYCSIYKLREWKAILQKLIKFAIVYLLGIGLVAFLLLPIIYIILNSPRISSTGLNIFNLNKPLVEYISLLKIFSQNIFGVADSIPHQFDKWYIFYEMPVLYSGILPLLIIPQILVDIKKEKKYAVYLIGIILSVISLLVPFFASMFNIFKAYNFRWSFIIICLNLLIFAEVVANSTSMYKSINRKTVYVYLTLLVPITTCLIMLKFFNLLVIDLLIIKEFVKVIIFIVLYYITLNLYYIRNKNISFKRIGVASLMVIELIIFSNTTINSGNLLPKNYTQSGQGYFDVTNKIISYVKNKENSKFYRVNKNYISQSENDSLIQNYRGLAGYNSVHTKSYVEFLNSMGITSKVGADAVITGVDETNQYLLSLMSVKYNILKTINSSYMYNYPGETVGYVPKYFKSIGKFDGYTLYENTTSLPLGITFSKKLDYENYNNLPTNEKQKALLYGFVSNDKFLNETFPTESKNISDFKNINIENPNFTGCEVSKDTQSNSYKLTANSGTSNIQLRTNQNNFAQGTLQFELDSPVQFEIQSIATKNNLNVQNIKTLVCAGKNVYKVPINSSADFIDLSFNLPVGSNIIFSNITLIGESLDISSQIDNLRQDAITIETFSNRKIEGNIKINEDRMALLSIPYERGWKCIVNGKKTTVYNIDGGLTGVLLKKGYNDIVLYYTPPFMVTGIIISLLVLVTMVAIIILNRRNMTNE